MIDRIADFETAIASIPWVAERIAAGQQFNVYDSADNEFDDDPEDMIFALCIGPITDHRFICPIVGQNRARLVEAAMKAATEALASRHLQAAGSEAGR